MYIGRTLEVQFYDFIHNFGKIRQANLKRSQISTKINYKKILQNNSNNYYICNDLTPCDSIWSRSEGGHYIMKSVYRRLILGC